MVLQERDGEFSLRLAGQVLMTSRSHGSEDALATLAFKRLKAKSPRVLVGGMGMGYTARAALDRVGRDGEVVIAELIPEVVEWNRGPLAAAAGNPLGDPRCSVILGDVRQTIARATGEYDALLLDCDNGPDAFVQKNNASLYSPRGLSEAHQALRPQGVYALWSASAEEWFVRTLHDAGFTGTMERSGPRHAIFVATRK